MASRLEFTSQMVSMIERGNAIIPKSRIMDVTRAYGFDDAYAMGFLKLLYPEDYALVLLGVKVAGGKNAVNKLEQSVANLQYECE